MYDEFKDSFIDEINEVLAKLEKSLLELEENPEDEDLVARAFRAMHTIKGTSSMFGFDNVSSFTHDVETVLDLLRDGKLAVSKELIDLTLSAADVVGKMLNSSDENGDAYDVWAKEIVESLRELAGEDLLAEAAERTKKPASQDKTEGISGSPGDGSRTYRIRFGPHPDIMKDGTKPTAILRRLRDIGRCTVVTNMDDIPFLENKEPHSCHTSWDIILTTKKGINDIRDEFIFIEDSCDVSIEPIADEDIDFEDAHKRLGEILVERGSIDSVELSGALGRQRRLGEVLVDAGVVSPEDVTVALAEQEHLKAEHEKKKSAESRSSVRVPSERLDGLVDLVGELVTVQARLSETVNLHRNPELVKLAEDVERLTAKLRDNAMGIRMMPIGPTLSKFKRLVRDLSDELGKGVDLVIEGAETELDKTVIERMNDPLVHIIRNCVDHGIELPDIREKSGKPTRGMIILSAGHLGSNVMIQITDDGAGLDPDVIRTKAIEKGLISKTATLSEKEIFSLILAPGFSTAKSLTSVSGRGVGMDVVKKNIDALRGSIDIESRKGEGTTISIRLPLTLAIIDGLLVRISDEFYVIPLSTVRECVEREKEEAEQSNGKRLAYIRNHAVPFISLRERFAINGSPPDIEQIVVTENDGTEVGFVVDEVIGQHQTVIKSLGEVYKNIDGLSGATILGNGTVALILDTAKLIQEELYLVNGGMDAGLVETGDINKGERGISVSAH
jgi:two-component system chemotaxis sensor kinase CheA